MKQLLKWETELVMRLLPDNKSGVMLFSSKIHIFKRDSRTIILYNRQYSIKLQLLSVRGTDKPPYIGDYKGVSNLRDTKRIQIAQT